MLPNRACLADAGCHGIKVFATPFSGRRVRQRFRQRDISICLRVEAAVSGSRNFLLDWIQMPEDRTAGRQD